MPMTAVCSQIKGSRTEYFLENPSGRKNHVFLDSSDAITNSYLKLFWESGSKEGLITIDDSPSIASKTHAAKAIIAFSDGQQLTFVSILNDAPIMVTLYPQNKVATYSMQSNWGMLASGVKANLFHAVCEINTGANQN